ncbi:hypothetical protein DVK85_01360 [Flavobacterium arcticum]|uniref:Transglutaminase-like domain-containing protein n=1 Tax=Flavobacterium arcticum TaxID=1784713 RepID=A0A345H8P0_9FLAO|nr:hypothetical protein [Flavobacterium arcticum]AXG72950.1 hypothetical protein DVK85_01360 [Flavobacterium arcticum]KAF2510386.1 hypothetical protein E0W72_07845 [Flavobacterium arcticum]
MTDFNTLLYRPLQRGKQYKKLIPQSDCNVVVTGNGMTDYSVKQMAYTVNKYHSHMAKVAPLLDKGSLQQTCNAIHDFCYNHFQYKIDEVTQKLRSPACSWSVRQLGIDCKSYSIIASSILTELGVKHYIRRIKNLAYKPDLWTHVYVVAPIDQESGNLDNGYYVIDGTVAMAIEPAIAEKDDYYMEHEVLAGAHPNALGFNLSDLQNLEKFKLDDVKGLVSNISCWGGTSYDKNDVDKNIGIITDYFNELVIAINQAVQQKNMNALRDRVTEFKGTANLIRMCFDTKRYRDNDWNSCTDKNLEASIKVMDFFKDTCGKALDAWLNDNFNIVGYAGTQSFQSTPQNSIEHTMGINFTYLGVTITRTQKMYNYSAKPKNIPAFEITDYVVQANNGSFNALQFIQGLTNTVANFTATNANNTGGSNVVDSNVVDYNNPNNVTQNGGGVVGWLLLIGALGYAGYSFTQMPDTGTKKQPSNKKITI